MAEAQQISEPEESVAAEPTATEKSLPDLLSEWDDHKRPIREPEGLPADALDSRSDEVKEFESRISALETEKNDLTERLEKSEAVGEFVEEALTARDQRDFERAAKHIVAETGLNMAGAEREIKLRLLEDPDFMNAAEARFDSTDFNDIFESLVDDLREHHPQTYDDRGLAAAVRISRGVRGATYGARDYGDLSKLSTAEFEAVSKEVFEAAETGKLQPNRRRGGFLGTRPSGG